MEHLTENPIAVFDLTTKSEGEFRLGATFVMEGWMLGICNSGQMKYQRNQDVRIVEKGTCFSWVPGQICNILDISEDANITLLHTSSDALIRLRPKMIEKSSASPIHIKEHLERMNHFQENSNMLALEMHLPEESCREIKQLLEVLRHHVHPQKEECNMNIATSLIESISWIILSCHHEPTKDARPLTRQELLTKEFFGLLIENHRKEHNVSFYAQKACVSAKYLSTVVNHVSGHSAQDWIERVLLFTAKRLLKSTDFTVAQVSDQLNFSSSSSFVRFFRQNAGVTPKEYRTT